MTYRYLHAFPLPPAQRLADESTPEQLAAGCLQAGAAWLAVGQWVSNTVELRQLSAHVRSQTLHLGDRQPRALLAAYLADGQHLFIGTSDGAVLFCSMICSAGGQLQHQQVIQGSVLSHAEVNMLRMSARHDTLCCAGGIKKQVGICSIACLMLNSAC